MLDGLLDASKQDLRIETCPGTDNLFISVLGHARQYFFGDGIWFEASLLWRRGKGSGRFIGWHYNSAGFFCCPFLSDFTGEFDEEMSF